MIAYKLVEMHPNGDEFVVAEGEAVSVARCIRSEFEWGTGHSSIIQEWEFTISRDDGFPRSAPAGPVLINEGYWLH